MPDGDAELLERPDTKASESNSDKKYMAKKADKKSVKPMAEQPRHRPQTPSEAHHKPTNEEGRISSSWASVILSVLLAAGTAIFGVYKITSSQSEKLTGLIHEVSKNQIASYGELRETIAISSTEINNLKGSVDLLRTEQKTSMKETNELLRETVKELQTLSSQER